MHYIRGSSPRLNNNDVGDNGSYIEAFCPLMLIITCPRIVRTEDEKKTTVDVLKPFEKAENMPSALANFGK
jgi:hypothetical protein